MSTYPKFLALTAFVLAAGLASEAGAATATGSFQVTMTVQGACSVQSATTLAFGSQTSLASNVDATSSIGVQCTNATPYTIALNAGGGTGATVASRVMTAGGSTIPYALYRDSGRSMNWGQTASVDTQGGTGNGAVQTYTVYGRVAPVSSPDAGSYADTIAVTVTY
jgi:spore coat protein U-like protein